MLSLAGTLRLIGLKRKVFQSCLNKNIDVCSEMVYYIKCTAEMCCMATGSRLLLRNQCLSLHHRVWRMLYKFPPSKPGAFSCCLQAKRLICHGQNANPSQVYATTHTHTQGPFSIATQKISTNQEPFNREATQLSIKTPLGNYWLFQIQKH